MSFLMGKTMPVIKNISDVNIIKTMSDMIDIDDGKWVTNKDMAPCMYVGPLVPWSNLETKAETKIMYLKVHMETSYKQMSLDQFGSHSRLRDKEGICPPPRGPATPIGISRSWSRLVGEFLSNCPRSFSSPGQQSCAQTWVLLPDC